jgi:large exoprotein involved in heme utilization and adhesion
VGGTITVTGADVVRLTEGGRIAVEARNVLGAAGNLFIIADRVDLDNGELSATTQASASGESANISLQNLDLLLLRNGSLVVAEAFNQADGGNIDIDADIILAVPTENSDIIANALEGNGGRITLTGERILGLTPRSGLTTEELRNNISSDVSASSRSGQQGEVVVENLGVDPSQGVTELPVLSSAPDVQQDCLAVNESGTSSFVVTGRGGLPTSPTDLLNPDVSLVDLGPGSSEGVSSNHGGDETADRVPDQGLEAQGWIRDTDGQIYFVSERPDMGNRGYRVSCSNH